MNKYGKFIYEKLPQIFRDEDNTTDYQLERFLEALDEGGFSLVEEHLKELEKIYLTTEVDLEYLKKLGKMFGYDYQEDLREDFQRRLISILPLLYRAKGTKPVIQYVAREVTGYDCEITENFEGDRNRVKFLMTSVDKENSTLYPVSKALMQKTVDLFLPVNINPLYVVLYFYQDYLKHNKISYRRKDTIGKQSEDTLHFEMILRGKYANEPSTTNTGRLNSFIIPKYKTVYAFQLKDKIPSLRQTREDVFGLIPSPNRYLQLNTSRLNGTRLYNFPQNIVLESSGKEIIGNRLIVNNFSYEEGQKVVAVNVEEIKDRIYTKDNRKVLRTNRSKWNTDRLQEFSYHSLLGEALCDIISISGEVIKEVYYE